MNEPDFAAGIARARAQLHEVLSLPFLLFKESSQMSDEYDGTQPLPIPNDGPSMHDLVIQDLETRKRFGQMKYGQILQAGNGRDVLQDLYEELIDALVYLRQLLEERPVIAVEHEFCPHDCDHCHGDGCPCDRLGCDGYDSHD